MTTGIVESGRAEATGRGTKLGIGSEVGSGTAVGIGTKLGTGATSGGRVTAGRRSGEASAGRVGTGASDGMNVAAGSGARSEPVQATDAVSAITSSARTPNSPPVERASNGPADRVPT